MFCNFQVFNIFVKFISKHFILLYAIVEGILFSISFWDFSLLVYRNTLDYCILNLFLVSLLNSSISSNCLLVDSLDSTKDHFILHTETVLLIPFQYECLLFYFLPSCPG